mgnify:CR=1 FL=1|tara:strand:- start:1995 stop:2999 length:1005 start_codon:yes stop_codon:yes gene_type:complete
MVLSTNPPFLFIHIPKTAGTSIEEALFEYQDFNYMNEPHPIVQQYRTYLSNDLYSSLFKFSFVRNPWALQVSTYKYYVVSNDIDMTFEEYIKWKFTGYPKDYEHRVKNPEESQLIVAYHMNRLPQTYFLIDEYGDIQMDFIGSLENIDIDFKTICNNLSLSDEVYLPHSNRSVNDNTKTFLDYYSDETMNIVKDRFSMDIKIYGYEFNLNKPNNTGFITKQKLSDYGVILPQNFYFNLGSLPYGVNDIIHRYDDDEMVTLKHDHDRRKVQRRVDSLNNNLEVITQSIHEKEEELFGCDGTGDTLLLQEDILKLREHELVYRVQINHIESELNKH